MKQPLSLTGLLLSSIILLNSCATSSISRTQRKADIVNSKETTAECFVQLNDGTIKHYNSLKLITSPFGTPYLLADGKTRIRPKQITAYQNQDHYAVSQKTFCFGRLSHVATEALPGFAVRTAKGKINVYCKKYYNGQVAVDEYFLQAGEGGKIIPYSESLMSELVKDNSEAYNLFTNKKFKGSSTEKLHATAQLYNNGQLMSKN
ncbi:MAG: hypothetical protein ABI741_11950 [Ferruginibacter sp.]